MEERKTIKISLSTMFLIIAIIVIAIMGYCIYTMSNSLKTLEKENQELSNSEINNAETDNKVESNKTEEDTNVKDEETQNEDTTGKIYIKRNGITTLEKVPTELVGKYVNSGESKDYFIINKDGTVDISSSSGGGPFYTYTGNEVELQITYIPDSYFGEIILEFYDKTEGNQKSLAWAFAKGQQDNDGNYSFATLEHTPTTMALEFAYKKQ